MASILSYGVAEVNPGQYNLTGYTVEGISAGWFVRGSASTATADLVTSEGTASLGKGDIQIQRCDAAADASFGIGIALEDIASGSYGTFATEGVFIVRAGGGIAAGAAICPATSSAHANSANCAAAVTLGTDDATKIGRAMTSASAAGKFILVKLSA